MPGSGGSNVWAARSPGRSPSRFRASTSATASDVNSITPNEVVGLSTRLQVVAVSFSRPISARQPVGVTSNASALNTRDGPSAGKCSSQPRAARCGGAGPGGSGGAVPEPHPASDAATSRTSSGFGDGIRACSHTPFGSLRRRVDLYEYQGKELFRLAGIPVSEGRLATSAAEAGAAAAELGGQVVVKAQVLTGGRGKAGGIKLAASPEEAEARANEILGLDIRGHVVRKLWIEQASEIAKEYYLSLTFDRGAKRTLYMFTTRGGVDIEQVAEESPDALVRLHVDPLEGFRPWQARRLVYAGGLTDPSEQKQIASIVERLYEAFFRFDAMLCEINPLIVTPGGEVKALDSKFTVDDNALYRHPPIAEMRDVEADDPLETLAREKHVTYVKLDGDVGVLGNGAGLTMSTVDVVTFAGGRPANFCDLGGGGDAQGVVDALSVITRDPQVKAIFFNIFGGITRCDEVARGILQALSEMTLELPIVVRLDGTNADEGRRILADAAPANLSVAPTMLEGAKQAVELAA